jgi:hypothetical protein
MTALGPIRPSGAARGAKISDLEPQRVGKAGGAWPPPTSVPEHQVPAGADHVYSGAARSSQRCSATACLTLILGTRPKPGRDAAGRDDYNAAVAAAHCATVSTFEAESSRHAYWRIIGC